MDQSNKTENVLTFAGSEAVAVVDIDGFPQFETLLAFCPGHVTVTALKEGGQLKPLLDGTTLEAVLGGTLTSWEKSKVKEH